MVMWLTEARALQKDIKAAGYHCIVPLGHGPDGYWCQTFTSNESGGLVARRHSSRADFRKFHIENLRRRRQIMREYERLRGLRDTRTPIERMIDEACGVPKTRG